MSEHWKLKTAASSDFLNFFPKTDQLLGQLLFNRGITSQEQVNSFLLADYKVLHDPYLFSDMKRTVDRIFLAIEKQEILFIYGDYDADAVTANAVLQHAFNFLGHKVQSYIPDRFSEGYGVNLEAIKKIKKQGASAVITVDCGTNSVEVAEWCRNNNLDFIITDHHEIIGPTPRAFALINPKNPQDNYPDKNITGVGVAFKLAAALLSDARAKKIIKNYKPGLEKWLLDLVAIGTVADCHSLIGENRLLVKYGLKVLPKTRWAGLKVLCRLAGLDFTAKEPDTYALGFIIAPRINAAGRLEHADLALNLLMENNPNNILEKAEKLEIINRRRQDLTAQVLSEAREKAQIISHRKVLVLSGNDWPKGVVGLVAGKLAEEFYKPTIVLSVEADTATGSARTVGDFSIIEALKKASGYLERFGGHTQAAGLTLKNENLEVFYQAVLSYAETNFSLKPKVLELDAELKVSELNFYTYGLIEKLEPFGVGNPKPKFIIKNLFLNSVKQVGEGGKHAQVVFDWNEGQIGAIGFNMTKSLEQYRTGSEVNVACELIVDFYKGSRKLKLKLMDISKI